MKDFIVRGDRAGKIEESVKLSNRGVEIARAEIVSYPLSYVDRIVNTKDLFYASNVGAKGKRLEVTLGQGVKLTCEDGNFSMAEGDVKFNKLRFDASSLIRNMVAKVTGDTFFRQELTGGRLGGKVYLKDTLSYLEVIELDRYTTVVLEKGTFYAALGNFEQGVEADLNLSTLLFSSRDKIITSLKGIGFVILELPVNPSEILKLKVEPDKPLLIDADSVLVRVGNIKPRVVTSGGVRNTIFNRTKLINSFEGTGYVYAMPSIRLYGDLSLGSIEDEHMKNMAMEEYVKRYNINK